jgi:hypothetical protein
MTSHKRLTAYLHAERSLCNVARDDCCQSGKKFLRLRPGRCAGIFPALASSFTSLGDWRRIMNSARLAIDRPVAVASSCNLA